MGTERKLAILTDLETGGMDEQEVDIIEYGALKVDRLTLEVLDARCFQVSPEHPVHPEAAKVNGYRAEDWRYALTQEEGFHLYCDFAEGGERLVSWNAPFERKFLTVQERRWGRKVPLDYHNRDIVGIIEEKLELKGVFLPKFRSDPVAEHFGLPPEEAPHHALRGAYQLLAVWRASRGI